MKHAEVGQKHPHVALAVAVDGLHPVVGILAVAPVLTVKKAERVGLRVVKIHTAVCSHPHHLAFVFIQGRNVVVALLLFVVKAVKPAHVEAVVAVKSVLRAEPYKSVAVFGHTLYVARRQPEGVVNALERIVARGISRTCRQQG